MEGARWLPLALVSGDNETDDSLGLEVFLLLYDPVAANVAPTKQRAEA